MVLLIGCLGPSAPSSGESSTDAEVPGFDVDGRHLYDRCGERAVLRGHNKMVVTTEKDGMPAFREIIKTGANAVRIMGITWAPADEFEQTLTNAVKKV